MVEVVVSERRGFDTRREARLGLLIWVVWRSELTPRAGFMCTSECRAFALGDHRGFSECQWGLVDVEWKYVGVWIGDNGKVGQRY